jgi:hypothetical protein
LQQHLSRISYQEEGVGMMVNKYLPGVFAILALLFSNACHAAWKQFGESDIGTSYYDPASVKKNGKKVTVWKLYDLKESKRYSNLNAYYQSNIYYTTIDCATETLQEAEGNFYSDRMGGGSLIESGVSAAPFKIEPDTIASGLKDILCK